MTYQHGKKPLKKVLRGGAEAARYVPIGMNKLRELYRNSAPLLENITIVGGAFIKTTKSVSLDTIYIRAAIGGYVVALRYRVSFYEGDDAASGEQINRVSFENYFHHSRKLNDKFTLSELKRPASANTWEGMAIPWNGKMLDSFSGVYDGEALMQMAKTSDLCDSFETEIEYSDSLAAGGLSNHAQPMVVGGARGFWMIVYQTGVLYIATHIEGEPAAYGIRIQKQSGFNGQVPLLTLVEANKCFCYIPESNYFAIFTERAEISDYFPNPRIEGIIDDLQMVTRKTCLIFARNADIHGVAYYDVHRFDLETHASNRVLTFEADMARWANVGNGAFVVLETNRQVINPDTGGVDGLHAVRWVSLDTGQTWNPSWAGIPQSDLKGATSVARISALGQLTAVEPYKDADDKGSVYTIVWGSWSFGGSGGEVTGEDTAVRLFKSTDLLQTWELVATIVERKDLPKEVYKGSDGATYERPTVPQNALLVGIGAPSTPIPIDMVMPWRVDNRQAAPSWWTAES